MGMMRLGILFPTLAERETRTVKVFEALPPHHPRHLPVDEYGFDELYCTERKCDCRRVIINVLARHARQHIATINHAFEKPAKDAPVPEQTFLDPLNRQSQWAAAILDLFVNVVLPSEGYRQRLLLHYRIFKSVAEDPAHPSHRLLHLPMTGGPQLPSRSKSIPTPPPRSGRRRKWK